MRPRQKKRRRTTLPGDVIGKAELEARREELQARYERIMENLHRKRSELARVRVGS